MKMNPVSGKRHGVIPANAGISVSFHLAFEANRDPRVRGDDSAVGQQPPTNVRGWARPLFGGGGGGEGGGVAGEVDDDGGTAWAAFLDGKRAAMQVDEGADDGEAEAGAALAAGKAGEVGTLGEFGAALLADRALVLDREQHAIAAGGNAETDFAAGLGEARGAGEEVVEHLDDAGAIGDEGGELGGNAKHEAR